MREERAAIRNTTRLDGASPQDIRIPSVARAPAVASVLAAREQLLSSLDALRQEHPELATLLVTHHLEELPASTTHALLLRGGQCVASGPADTVVTTDQVSTCFGHPVRISRTEGRWTARAERVSRPFPPS